MKQKLFFVVWMVLFTLNAHAQLAKMKSFRLYTVDYRESSVTWSDNGYDFTARFQLKDGATIWKTKIKNSDIIENLTVHYQSKAWNAKEVNYAFNQDKGRWEWTKDSTDPMFANITQVIECIKMAQTKAKTRHKNLPQKYLYVSYVYGDQLWSDVPKTDKEKARKKKPKTPPGKSYDRF